ncbi:hypothetical protein HGB07_01270 [Candidatus Roizmanbacteria bacterium]|nr:hypothetical protein [Candidatus Roizmanbacteria bacterium]
MGLPPKVETKLITPSELRPRVAVLPEILSPGIAAEMNRGGAQILIDASSTMRCSEYTVAEVVRQLTAAGLNPDIKYFQGNVDNGMNEFRLSGTSPDQALALTAAEVGALSSQNTLVISDFVGDEWRKDGGKLIPQFTTVVFNKQKNVGLVCFWPPVTPTQLQNQSVYIKEGEQMPQGLKVFDACDRPLFKNEPPRPAHPIDELLAEDGSYEVVLDKYRLEGTDASDPSYAATRLPEAEDEEVNLTAEVAPEKLVQYFYLNKGNESIRLAEYLSLLPVTPKIAYALMVKKLGNPAEYVWGETALSGIFDEVSKNGESLKLDFHNDKMRKLFGDGVSVNEIPEILALGATVLGFDTPAKADQDALLQLAGLRSLEQVVLNEATVEFAGFCLGGYGRMTLDNDPDKKAQYELLSKKINDYRKDQEAQNLNVSPIESG